MGVSIRMSRNVRIYLPLWLALPAYLIAAVVWTVIVAVWLLAMLLVVLPARGIRYWRRTRRA